MAVADRVHVLVEQHLHLVAPIARRVRREIRTALELEDLEGHGMVGLVQAARRYDDRGGATFATFAAYRIRGAMVDAVRKLGLYTRGEVARHRATLVPHTAAPKAQPASEVADDGPLADELSVARERRRRLQAALGRLPAAERRVLDNVVLRGRGGDGGRAEMSKSWESRLHRRAVERLRRLVAER